MIKRNNTKLNQFYKVPDFRGRIVEMCLWEGIFFGLQWAPYRYTPRSKIEQDIIDPAYSYFETTLSEFETLTSVSLKSKGAQDFFCAHKGLLKIEAGWESGTVVIGLKDFKDHLSKHNDRQLTILEKPNSFVLNGWLNTLGKPYPYPGDGNSPVQPPFKVINTLFRFRNQKKWVKFSELAQRAYTNDPDETSRFNSTGKATIRKALEYLIELGLVVQGKEEEFQLNRAALAQDGQRRYLALKAKYAESNRPDFLAEAEAVDKDRANLAYELLQAGQFPKHKEYFDPIFDYLENQFLEWDKDQLLASAETKRRAPITEKWEKILKNFQNKLQREVKSQKQIGFSSQPSATFTLEVTPPLKDIRILWVEVELEDSLLAQKGLLRRYKLDISVKQDAVHLFERRLESGTVLTRWGITDVSSYLATSTLEVELNMHQYLPHLTCHVRCVIESKKQ